MPLKEHIYSVLIVSASAKFNEQINSLLAEPYYRPVDFAVSINEAQRKITERPYDLILVNTPLPDDFGAKFSIDVSVNKNCVVLIFVRSELYEGIYDKICDYGVFSIRKPISPQYVLQALDWLKATRERLRRLEKKSMSLQEKMDEIKIINRAKWTLINSLKMSEQDAHRYIEKQAMDRCVSKREIAENIIHTYK